MPISEFVYIYLPTASQVRLQKFVGCAFLIRKVCRVPFFEYKFCSVRFFETTKVCKVRFLIKKVCSVRFFDYKTTKFLRCAFLIKKVCSVRFLRLQKFVVGFSDILECP
ncbi:hypothetical protein K443DRAFT_97467 [Laccaria amethystina LaAM-08-1]|uniref:Uncharacterized protein n=1 Tax=Laccaria amethystina LaAM-08-1 TaxID=1095629 RepID=A0A0C9XB48_9AGAR|nr:hypothetical protein K443DRAFT_97467 [Laccaria amethystina LaAM-08-1]